MTSKIGVLIGAFTLISGCGVKGDPLPPEAPPRLGRGRPTFTSHSGQMSLPELPAVKRMDDSDDNEERDDEAF